jgi:hypothetical protein
MPQEVLEVERERERRGGSLRAVVTVGGRAGSLTEVWSVDVAGISEVVGLNVAAVGGGASVTVHGSSMGQTGYTERAHGVRGDGEGVGLGGAMQGRGGGREDTTSGGDSWGASRQSDGGMVDRRTRYECGANQAAAAVALRDAVPATPSACRARASGKLCTTAGLEVVAS